MNAVSPRSRLRSWRSSSASRLFSKVPTRFTALISQNTTRSRDRHARRPDRPRLTPTIGSSNVSGRSPSLSSDQHRAASGHRRMLGLFSKKPSRRPKSEVRARTARRPAPVRPRVLKPGSYVSTRLTIVSSTLHHRPTGTHRPAPIWQPDRLRRLAVAVVDDPAARTGWATGADHHRPRGGSADRLLCLVLVQ